MPRKKTAAKTKKVTQKEIKKTGSSNVFEYLRFGESYTSLILGIIAVIIATILLLSFFNTRQQKHDADIIPTVVEIDTMHITITPEPEKENVRLREKTYTVSPDDNLWSIAQRVYGSGYNWVDIAKANNLANPDDIHVGDRLALPNVISKEATVETGENEAIVSRSQRVVNDNYTVVAGDELWDIAVKAYGDGYQWVKIAEANHLENPNIIHAGNVLIIPRN